MKWKGRRQSENVEDDTTDTPPEIPAGTKMVDGSVWGGNKKYSDGNTEFNPNDPAEVKVVRELGKKNITGKTPIPTPRPKDNGTHDNLVTPGKWVTKSK